MMSLTVKITQKELRFNGNSERRNIVVNGDEEVIDRARKRCLFLHGLKRVNPEEAHAIWTSRPTNGAQPLNLAILPTYGRPVRLNRGTQDMHKQAVSERAKNGEIGHTLNPRNGVEKGGRRSSSSPKPSVSNWESDNAKRTTVFKHADRFPWQSVTDRSRRPSEPAAIMRTMPLSLPIGNLS